MMVWVVNDLTEYGDVTVHASLEGAVQTAVGLIDGYAGEKDDPSVQAEYDEEVRPLRSQLEAWETRALERLRTYGDTSTDVESFHSNEFLKYCEYLDFSIEAHDVLP